MKINSIAGISLSSVEMRSVKGGIDKPKVCGNTCGIEGHANYACAKDAIGFCVCKGTNNQGQMDQGKCTMVETE